MDRFGHTEAVYHRDETQHVMETTVLASIPYADWDNSINKVFKDASDGLFLVITNSTIFYAKGGGQPSDTGTMTSRDQSSIFTVTSVQKLPSGTIMHLGTYSGAPFEEQTLVTQEINKDTRKLHSQIHDAGHILASAVRRLGIPDLREVKAQHYPGTAFVDFQGIIPGDRKEEIEQLANQIVNDDRSINVHWWSREELEAKSWTMPEDSDGQDGLVRAVEIDGEGAYMCGGTHVRSTALVGKIRVRKVKRQQGISRVSYELV
ncbi:related to alanyl-tRNA synthetase [Fusarium oxysporum]|uniref:Related to alanyl-tRNA synthetase n=2 Tax=Fusarium oxysporum TaxID=5507 RepID=A0A2H3U1I2_FUSOX|nr:Threonyl/alanyl tRNA synthetase [Fusarium oxysporum]SCO90850.1 related to alanyl-tRNA synthetase [Fusarium oxysporum]